VKVLAINGSPRKTRNTGTLLQHALDGAASRGAVTELVHLYDYEYIGCTSCFACKVRNGKSYGKCSVQDGLAPVLEKITGVDAIILGSPVYFGTVTGMMRSFMERLLFPYLVYAQPPVSLFGRKIPSAFVYTMNVAEHQIPGAGYGVHFSSNKMVMERMFGGPCESLYAYETRQFDDYSKVVFSYVDPAERVQKAEKQFPIDCEQAFDLGVRLTAVSG
jgi:putative NADPH-quinone reductase